MTPSRRPHDQRNLRDHPGGPGVAAEDLPVQGEGNHPLLNARTTALVDPDQGAAGLQGEVDDLDDLLAVDLAQRAAEDRHVLAEDADGAAMDGAGAGDHTVPVGAAGIHPEVLGTVPGELVQLRETALVQERQHSLASCHLALGVLHLDGGGGTGVDGRVDATSQIRQLAGSGVDVDVHAWNLSVRAKRVRWDRLRPPAMGSAAMPGREADIHVAPWVSGVEELRCRRASRRARVHRSRSG